jgi:hypothetical protein
MSDLNPSTPFNGLSTWPIWLFIAGIWVVNYLLGDQRRLRRQLSSHYQQALLSGDSQAALEAGRAYYAHLNGGVLSEIDDLRVMHEVRDKLQVVHRKETIV